MRDIAIIVVLLLTMFLVGFLGGSLYQQHVLSEEMSLPQTTLSQASEIALEETAQALEVTPSLPVEHPSPRNRINQEDVQVLSNRVVINIPDVQWAMFTDTNSMDPVYDTEAHALQIVPSDPSEIQVGDIIAFTTEETTGVISHRVVSTGVDEQGWYAVTKGDNNAENDPGIRRFIDVKRVVIGLLY